MSTGQGQGGGKKPPQTDDRTLLDPLSNDELKALREARQRMQAKKGSAVAHQIVIGPDSGEDIGDAPTRAMPALPTFESNATLEKIGTRPAQDPASRAPQEPMSTAPTVSPAVIRVPGPSPTPGPGPGPIAGPTGFGENTLLWMQPPKLPTDPGAVGVSGATGDLIPKASPKEVAVGRLKTAGMVGIVAIIAGGVIFAATGSGGKGVVEVHTNPPRAQLKVDGDLKSELTPVKLTLREGTHSIEVALDGHQPEAFTVEIKDGAESLKKDIDLTPISKPGLQTVSIEVQPVAAAITVDGVVYGGKRNIKIADIDPNANHKITIEAGGYVKVEQDITAGQLKGSYTFALQQDEDQKPN